MNAIKRIEEIARDPEREINLMPAVDMDDEDVKALVHLAYTLGRTRALADLQEDTERRMHIQERRMVDTMVQALKAYPESKAYAEAVINTIM